MSAQSIDPNSGQPFGPVIADTSAAELDTLLDAAVHASVPSRADRVAELEGIAESLAQNEAALVDLAAAETALSPTVLAQELARTVYQLRRVAVQVGRGDYLNVRVDMVDPSPLPVGRPDLRRILVPVGPVAVFGASNFPFAFGVAGGDTATALGAGCAVVVKAHPAHPQVSARIGALIDGVGLADGRFALVHGVEIGRSLVLDERVRAAAFTGSTGGGRALFDLAMSRPRPIAFFGELGAVNPTFVTSAGAADSATLAQQWVESLMIRYGQMCTNPGLLIVPAGTEVPQLSATLLAAAAPAALLTAGIARGFLEGTALIGGLEGATVLLEPTAGPGATVSPGLICLSAAAALAQFDAVQTECFGPAGVIVEYETEEEAIALAAGLHGTLAAGLRGEVDEPLAARLVPLLASTAGRVLWNGWPTGIAVTDAQQHGGPYPASTDAAQTSVGSAAIARFLRPVAYQNMPAALLPAELRSA